MSDQEDPMRTTVKPVHPWTTAEGDNPRKPSTRKWLFWAMLLWPVIMVMVSIFAQFADYLMFFGSPVVAARIEG